MRSCNFALSFHGLGIEQAALRGACNVLMSAFKILLDYLNSQHEFVVVKRAGYLQAQGHEAFELNSRILEQQRLTPPNY